MLGRACELTVSKMAINKVIMLIIGYILLVTIFSIKIFSEMGVLRKRPAVFYEILVRGPVLNGQYILLCCWVLSQGFYFPLTKELPSFTFSAICKSDVLLIVLIAIVQIKWHAL